MTLLLIILLLVLLFGGGGYYYGGGFGPFVYGPVGVIILIVVLLALTGRI